MTADEIRSVVYTHAAVKMPRFTPGHTPRERVELLEDYLNLTAVARAELDEARLYAYAAMRELSDQWDAIEGWHMLLRRRRPSEPPTQAEVTAAKRECRPDLYGAINELKGLISRLSEQIHRLEIDDRAASRLYTIITGA